MTTDVCAACGSNNIQHGLDKVSCLDCGKESWEDGRGEVSEEDHFTPTVVNPSDFPTDKKFATPAADATEDPEKDKVTTTKSASKK